jgi:hypothetical protein
MGSEIFCGFFVTHRYGMTLWERRAARKSFIANGVKATSFIKDDLVDAGADARMSCDWLTPGCLG